MYSFHIGKDGKVKRILHIFVIEINFIYHLSRKPKGSNDCVLVYDSIKIFQQQFDSMKRFPITKRER